MLSNRGNIINVYGDSLDSCIYTRILSEKYPNKQIIHYSSEYLGGIYSNKSNMLGLLSEKQVNLLLKYEPDLRFIPITESYIKVPYTKLKFKNTTDGNLRFPFTKKTFEFEYDYNDNILSTPTYDEFITRYGDIKNLVKLMKEIFSESFYMDVSKKIGTNIYNTIQSQIDPRFLYKTLFNLESLALDDYYIYYTPVGGFEDLCLSILDKDNIKLIVKDRKTIKNILSSNKDDNYVFDYFDYYFDFIFGGIEYIKYHPKLIKTTLFNTDVITITQTPYDKKYGMYYQIDSSIFSVSTSKYLIHSNTFDYCLPIPTQSNYKKINQYIELTASMNNIRIIF